MNACESIYIAEFGNMQEYSKCLPLPKYLFFAIISSVTAEFMIIMLNYFLYIISIHLYDY